MTITAEQILTKAIENWRTKGWCQGQSFDFDGRTCLVGGVTYAAHLLGNNEPETYSRNLAERQKAIRAIADVVNDDTFSATHDADKCIEWNDQHGRTVEEVITAAEQARANLKRELDQ